jgi:hypothetical protein
MGDDLDTLLAAARLAAAARSDPQARAFAEQRMANIVAGLDFGELTARALASGDAHARDMRGLYGEMGAWGEAIAASAAAEDGWVPIHHATRPGQTGIDVALFNPETDEIRVLEVKTTATDAPFRTSKTQHGRQTSPAWTDHNLPRAGLENVSSADVSVRGAHVNVKTGRVTWQEPADATGSRWRAAPPSQPAERPKQRDPPRRPPQQHGPSGPATPAGAAPHQPRTPPPPPKPAPRSEAAPRQRPASPAAPPAPPPSRPSGGRVVPGDKRVPAGDRRFA